MADLLNAIWELRTVIVFLAGVTAGLVIAGLLAAARGNEEPSPVDDSRDMIDMQGFFRKWEDK